MRARLADDIRNQRVWMTSKGFMCVRQEDEGLDIILLVGARRDALCLLDAARALTAELGKKEIFWIAPQVARAEAWAAAARMTRDEDGLMIYELAL
jgi:hypothetical protein